MRLNELKDNPGSRKLRLRVGRGIGSGMGKTGGRGGKGQTARAGVRLGGFEGGQMPLHRRLPKRGFVSLTGGDTVEVRLSAINEMTGDDIDILVLKQAGVVPNSARAAKVILAGEIRRKVNLRGLLVTKGARAAIEKAGGIIEG